jgi:hypothetical protein
MWRILVQSNGDIVTGAADKHKPLDELFWNEVVARSNALAALEQIGRHLSNTGLIFSNGSKDVALTLDAGKIRMGESQGANSSIRLKAVDDLWSKLLNGDMHFYHATNPYVGGAMEVSGNGLLVSWSLPTVIMLLRVATSVWTGRPFKMPAYQV